MTSREPEKTIQELVATNKDLMRTSQTGGPVWELVKIVIPTILTVLLGFWIWYLERKIETQVGTNTQLLQARLAVSGSCLTGFAHPLSFLNEISRIERFSAARKPDGAEVLGQHCPDGANMKFYFIIEP